jgi:hypothetical protein
MEAANTLAYYDTATIMAVKSFKVQGGGHLRNASLGSALLSNIRLSWGVLSGKNALAYSATLSVTRKKSFITSTPGLPVPALRWQGQTAEYCSGKAGK